MTDTRKALGEGTGRCDVVVVGAGVAGLYAALTAAHHGADVVVLAKGPLEATASHWAQGGIAAAVGEDDSAALHVADTDTVGWGLCRPSAVEVLAAESPARVADVAGLGVCFDEVLGLEAGHSRRRVLSVDGAATGQRVATTLAQHVLEHPRVRVCHGERALAVWTGARGCVGVITDRRALPAPATIVATGGAAALWERTTNPAGAVGEGIVMAYRAGAPVADLEFVQFHPTALVGTGTLLSEALRGEGAVLLDGAGRRFTDELAPRDVVARAIDARGTALLDLRPVDRERFHGLMAVLERAGFHPGSEPVPVAPAAHYTMGGVVTDLWGRSEVPGLYAVGEVACTGVHGANRLASNSLAECLVFAHRAALAALGEEPLPQRLPPVPRPARDPEVTPEVRRAVWTYAGLVRDAAGLEGLRRSAVPLARLVAESAVARAESRGAHFRADFPCEDPAFAGHLVLRAQQEPVLERWS